MGKEDTWTIGGLIADAVRNSRRGQSVEAFLRDVRSRGVDPHSVEYKELVESMQSMEGGQTPTRGRGRHGASQKLSRSERRAADADLRKGRRR